MEAKEINPEQLEMGGNIRKALADPNMVLCVDAIDEIRRPEIRIRIQTLLSEIGKGCVITSRPSEIDGFANGVISMELEGMNAEKFITSRMPDVDSKRRVMHSLREMGFVERIHANPLMLSFACMLE